MPKRKRSKDLENDLGHLMRKMKKLERKIRRRKNSDSDSDSQSDVSPSRNVTIQSVVHRPGTPQPVPDANEWLPVTAENEVIDDSHSSSPNIVSDVTHDITNPECNDTEIAKNNDPTTESNVAQEGPSTSSIETQELDSDILEILGEDPSAEVKYSAEIRKEIASRFQHIAQEGLSKENRKDLVTKYPVPANCIHIGAPKLNLEIKAALPEAAVKRDKGIESKQKQMASAISCLGGAITAQLNSKTTDNDLLQKLMDTSRLLCDIQHADSATRRNFISFTIKKDMKEHLTNTKIDSCLFGENLAETLKSAKAVNKSGVELKVDSSSKNLPKRTNTSTPKPLNRRAPAPARRKLGAPTRSRELAAQRAPPPLPLAQHTVTF